MKINSLEFYNTHSKLKINKITFDAFTLLVGASGVGKTQILRSLTKLKSIVMGEAISGFCWTIEFNIDQDSYSWNGEFEALSNFDAFIDSMPFKFEDDDKPKPKVLSEKIVRNGYDIVTRTGDDIIFNGSKTVKLSSTESVIHLLREEDDISILHKSFNRIILIEPDDGMSFSPKNNKDLESESDLSINDIRQKKYSLNAKLYLCQEKQPEYFNNIKSTFKDIFPYVEDVKIEKIESSEIPFFFNGIFVIKVKERGVDDWIVHSSMSTGMLKTLIQIGYIHLSPKGTVFLIDEFENGFGVNCINDITDILLHHGNGVQFIITSHHPYIINNIPLNNWKIISRRAGQVDNFLSTDFNLQESNHEAFTKLINLNVYVDGADK